MSQGSFASDPGSVYTAEEAFADEANEAIYVKTVTALGVTGRKDLLLPLAHRQSYIEYVKAVDGKPNAGYWATKDGQSELAYWQSPVGQDAFNALNEPQELLSELTDLVRRYSDDSTIRCLTKTYGSLRDFFETSTPTTQCANTVRNVVPNTTTCWICGTRITGYPGAGPFKGLELQPECEHVFPIAQALVFSGLYEAQLFKQIQEREGTTAAEAYRRGVTYEYKWAHRICNQVKNDTHYISHTKTSGVFSIDLGKVNDFLTRLQTTPNYGGGRLLMQWIQQERKMTPDVWRAAAGQEIVNTSQALLAYANTSGLTPQQHMKVTLMCVRSYIATSKECAGATEQIPDYVTKTGTPGPGRPLTAATMSAPVEAAKHFIAAVSEQMTGVVQLSVGRLGRQISAKDRALFITQLPDAGLVLRGMLEQTFTYLALNGLRQKMLYYLKSTVGKEVEGERAWSAFQVGMSQIVPGAIYATTADNGPAEIAGKIPYGQVLLSPVIAQDLQAWKNGYLQRIRNSGVPYDAILAMNPNVDPRPDIATPRWFEGRLSGGGLFPRSFSIEGGGLETPHDLSTNARTPKDSPPSGGRRGLYTRLRKRSRPRRTARLRQPARKSRTRRQRKSLDRL
jgi:hypothetical protein